MKINDRRPTVARVSRGFRSGFWFLAAALVVANPCAGARRPAKPVASPVELDLVMDAPTPTVMVQTDRGPLTMLLDTGSTVTSLAKAGPLLITFKDGSTLGLYANAQKDCPSDFHMVQGRSTFRLDGVLGKTFFEHFRRLTVDYARGKVVLEP